MFMGLDLDEIVVVFVYYCVYVYGVKFVGK